MARQVSKRVVEQSRALSQPGPPAPPPAAYVGNAPVDIDLSLEDLGPPKATPPPPPVGVLDLPPLEDARRQRQKSSWTGRLTFGLQGQPYSYAAVRMALVGGFLFPPLLLAAIVAAIIGVARGEPAGVKVFAWVTIGSVVYCAILAGLIMVIVDMSKMLSTVHY